MKLFKRALGWLILMAVCTTMGFMLAATFNMYTALIMIGIAAVVAALIVLGIALVS